MRQELLCLQTASGLLWEKDGQAPFETFVAYAGASMLTASISGIGKSLAAASAQHLIDRFEPSRLISLGMAGAVSDKLSLGDIALPGTVMQGDVGVYHRGGFLHPLSWRPREEGMALSHCCEAEEALRLSLAQSLRANGHAVHEEPLVTCDQVILSRRRREELRRLTGACAVDMESGVVALVAHTNGISFLAVRSISDTLDMEVDEGSVLFLMQSGRRRDRMRLAGKLVAQRGSRRLFSSFREGRKLSLEGLASASRALLELLGREDDN